MVWIKILRYKEDKLVAEGMSGIRLQGGGPGKVTTLSVGLKFDPVVH